MARAPQNFTWARRKRGGLLLAHGRDPYFLGQPDTLQLNYGNPVRSNRGTVITKSGHQRKNSHEEFTNCRIPRLSRADGSLNSSVT